MSEMSVKMTLTLSDAATAPLTAFIDKLKSMEGIVANVNAKMAGLKTGLEGIGATAGAASAGTGKLESALGSLAAGIGAMETRLNAAIDSFSGLGASAATAGNEVLGATAKMDAAGTAVGAVTERVNGLSTSLKGMAQLWAAFEVKKGLTASVEQAADYQSTQTRLKNLNLAGDGAQQITSAANSTSQAVPQFSREQTLSIGIDLVNATGSVEHAIHMMKPFAEAVYNMKAAMPAGQTFTDRDMLLLAKALEQRGVTTDPTRMQASLDIFSKITAATQGRVGPQQLLGNLQYSKGGLGLTMEDKFMPIFASLIERTVSGGGNSGQVGTALTALQQAIVGGVIKQSALVQWDKMGLLDPSKIVWNKVGTLKGVQAGGVAGAELFMRNPNEWVQQYLVPALKNSGVDTSNTEQVNGVLAHMFGNRNAANIASIMATQQNLINKDAGIIDQTLNNAGQRANNIDTAKAKWDQFHAALDNLANAIGTSVLPAITGLINAFTSILNGVAQFAADHQFVSQLGFWGLALTGIGLALNGLKNMFGLAFPAMAANAEASGGVITGILGRISSVFLRFIPVIGQLAGLFLLAEWVSNLEIGGVKIKVWAAATVDWVVTKFENGWIRIKNILGFMSDDAAKAALGANNAAFQRGLSANGITGTEQHGASGSWGGGASGSWTPNAPAPKAHFFKPSGINPTGHTARSHAAKPVDLSLEDLARVNAQADKELEHFNKVRKDIAEMNRDYMKLTGGSDVASVIADTQRAGDAKSKEFRDSGYSGAAQKNDDLTKLKIANLQYADAMEKVKAVEDALTESEKELGYAIEAGTITALDAANAQIEMRRKAAAVKLPLLADAASHAVNQTEKDTVHGKIASAQADLISLSKTSKDVKDLLQGSFEGMFDGILNRTKTLKQAFGDFFKSLADGFAKLVSQALAQNLMKAMFGGTSGDGASPSSGIGNVAVKWISSLIQGNFAVGTDYVPHDMVAMIHKGEKITPAAYNTPKHQNGGNVTQHMNFNFDSPQTSQTMMQIAAASGMAMQRAMARNL